MKSNSFPEVKILIVDDKSENLLALNAAFKGSGYKLVEALSGKEALEAAKLHDFACILLDVQMPILDGFETAMALRKIPKSEKTPIIFVTAINRSDEIEELGYVAGAVDYLFKPINPKILLAKVAIFVDLFLQAEEIKKKNILLIEAIQKSKENEDLRLALKSRDEFLMMASHELKTPITPLFLQMESFIHLFESGLVSTIDPQKLLRMLHTSQGQVERISRLVNELVDVSKISTGKLDLSYSLMSLKELTEKVLGEFEEEIKTAGCEVITDFKTDPSGKWDSFRIEQVLINLLSNALKYAARRPIEITISEAPNGDALFSIKDYGIGIDQADHQRIFKRFERAVSGEYYSGLGLGLFISHEIVTLHQGRMWVEGEKDKGSTFFVQLPLQMN